MSYTPEQLEKARIWYNGKKNREIAEGNLRALKFSDEVIKDVLDFIERENAPTVDRASTPAEVKAAESASKDVPGTFPHDTFAQICIPLIERHIPVTPVRPGTKRAFLPDFPTTATTDVNQVLVWDAQFPGHNAACVARPVVGEVFFWEVDSPNVRDRILQQTGHDIYDEIKTFKVRSRPGRGHFYFRHTPSTLTLPNISQSYVIGQDWSVRTNREYVVAPGSIHPDTGEPYTVLSDAPIAEAPQWLLDWLLLQKVQKQSAASTGAGDNVPRNANGRVPHGSIHGWMLTQAGKLRQQGLNQDEIEPILLRLVHENCEPPIDDSKVKEMAKSICIYEPGDPRFGPLVLNQSAAPEGQATQPQIDIAALAGEAKTESVPTNDAELDKEFPVIPLPPQPGPYWNDSILYGPLGEITKRACEYSESHPAGIYLDLIVAMGNVVGRKPYFRVNNTEHHTNEFMVRVGPTAKGRKGGGRDIVDAIMKLVDQDWATNRVMSGFGSGEAMIDPIRDPFQQQVRDRKGNGTFKNITVPGSADKRLFIRAGEIATTFSVASREGSRMSDIIRDAWDSKPLRNQVKGKTDGISNTLVCQEPHVSASADCTKEELIDVLPDNSAENGFANRFIFVWVHQVKLCPLGGPDIDWSRDVVRLHDVIVHANDNVKYVGLTRAAEKMWARMYVDLSQQETPGMAGKVTARAAAHIRRIALILALVDLEEFVDSQHLKAARAIWDYCQQSTEYIFNSMTKDQARIVRFAEKQATAAGTPVTDRLICDEVFHRNEKIAWVKAQVDGLVQSGHLIRNGDIVTRGGKI